MHQDVGSDTEPLAPPPARERAGEFLHTIGQRLTETQSRVAAVWDHVQHAEGAAETPGVETPTALVRAEQTIDRFGQQLGRLGVVAMHRTRRWLALAREETEDIWAEARDIHRRLRHPSQ